MITFIIMESCMFRKCQFCEMGIQESHTFKVHISTRWILVSIKGLHKLLVQGSSSNLNILSIILISIIYLYDQIIKFCEDCDNGNCIISVSDKEFGHYMWTHRCPHVSYWRTFVPMAIEGGRHPEWSKTWMPCYANPTKDGDETHQIAWSWSWTSFAFAFSSRKASMSWSSSAPPASNPGESWNMKRGLLLKENGRRISCIPRYRFAISDQPDKNQIGR